MFLIEAEAMLVEESLIMQIRGNDLVRHCEKERGVCRGLQRQPLVGERRCGFGEARIDHNDPGACFPGPGQVIIGVGFEYGLRKEC